IRRTVRAMRLLGAHDPTFGELADVSIRAMEPQYPELRSDYSRVREACEAEERSFLQTLQSGSRLFDQWIAEHGGRPEHTVEVTRASGRHEEYATGASVPGDVAFKLHDTYGFPIDLTQEMAAEKGLTVDTDGFRELMRAQKERSKADAKSRKAGAADLAAYRSMADEVGPTEFTGYEEVAGEGRVRGLLVDGEPVRSAPAGTAGEVGVDRTPS